MARRLTALLAGLLLLIAQHAHSEDLKDVREMGDIWVVTIDKSGSVADAFRTNKRVDYDRLGSSVYNRLMNGDYLDSADFEKDRFLFLVSGFKFYDKNRLSQEMTSAPPFVKSFIHATDGKLHAFANKRACARHIQDLLSRPNYRYNLSFVSQIRLFSIIHAVNLLKAQGETNSFEEFKLLTITDDADVNDQWRTDFRNLNKWAPNKVEEVNDSTSKYLYNALNGMGTGYLTDLSSDEKNTPHLWVYRYRSMRQDVPVSEMDLFSIDASDGKTVRLTPKVRDIQGDSLCFFHIDSIRINEKVIAVDSTFTDVFSTRCSYENALKRNETEIWGFAQVEYADPIFGKHSKIVPFTQRKTVLSKALAGVILAVCAILLLSLVGLLIYLLIIRPNSTLFTIYSSAGKKTTVKRGFAADWKGEYIPIQCYQGPYDGHLGVLVRKHRDIRVVPYPSIADRPSEVLIRSRHAPGISVEAVRHDTTDDIEAHYSYHSADYSPLLRAEYEKTVFCKLYRLKATAQRRWLPLIRVSIRILNFFFKRHYCLIKDVEAHSRYYLSMDDMLPGKRFTLEYFKMEQPVTEGDVYRHIALRTLTHYYSIDCPRYDLIICRHFQEQGARWIVLRLNDDMRHHDSLRSVESLIRYAQDKGEETKYQCQSVMEKALAKEFPGKRIGFFDTSKFSPTLHTLSFELEESSCPGYISLVETCEHPRIQQLYSPFKDTGTKEKFIRPKKGYQSCLLYLSAAPFQSLPDNSSLKKKLTNTIVSNKDTQPSLLRLHPDHFEYREISEKY